MTERKSARDGALPRLHTPEEVAAALGCSEWWVKEQARRRRIPFIRAGGAYRFTADHFAEIVSLFEERPSRQSQDVPETLPKRQRRRTTTGNVTPLRARRPRRSVTANQLPAAS